jgi:hypothetical protein
LGLHGVLAEAIEGLDSQALLDPLAAAIEFEAAPKYRP